MSESSLWLLGKVILEFGGVVAALMLLGYACDIYGKK